MNNNTPVKTRQSGFGSFERKIKKLRPYSNRHKIQLYNMLKSLYFLLYFAFFVKTLKLNAMKKLFYVLTILLMIGCAPTINNNTASQIDKTAKDYVKSNAFLDFDIDNLDVQTRSAQNVVDNEMFKAALYRFYRHVKNINGYDECDIKSGKDINVSDKVFSYLINNMNSYNQLIKDAKDKGENTITKPLDESYFENLLK